MADAPAFTAYPLDRADQLRRDEAGLTALMERADTTVAPLQGLKVLVREAPDPLLTSPLQGEDASGRHGEQQRPPPPSGGGKEEVRSLQPAYVPGDQFDYGRSTTVFLGLRADGAAVFAAAVEAEFSPPAGARFEELRAAAASLEPGEASILAAARSVLAWHAGQGFCSVCGAKTAPAGGGWKRVCSACGLEHFPRVDPVVIMLIVRGEAILLGRQAAWPERFYSCLAGFVEPGETIEAAARREAREEAGVVIGAVDYLTSQPWPFPSSMMLGVRAEALSDAIKVDQQELSDARWFSRADVQAIMAGTHPDVRGPSPVAVAHHLIRWWLKSG